MYNSLFFDIVLSNSILHLKNVVRKILDAKKQDLISFDEFIKLKNYIDCEFNVKFLDLLRG